MDYLKNPEPMDIYTDILAGKGMRFANFVIDMAARYLLIFLISMVVALLAGMFELEGVIIWMQTISKIEDFLISYFIMFLYFLVFESVTQRSLGKFITGTKVVMIDGTKPEFRAILIRSASRLVPFDALSFLGDTPIGWHDRWSDTVVVDTKKYNEVLRLKNSFDQIGKE